MKKFVVFFPYLSSQAAALFFDRRFSVMMMLDAMSSLKTQNAVWLTSITTGTDNKSKLHVTKNHSLPTQKCDILISDVIWTE